MYQAWSNNPVTLVDSWEILGRDSRIVTIFSDIISSQELRGSPVSMPCVAEDIFGSLMILGLKSKEPVKIFINSKGGSVLAGFTILQAMNHLKAKGIEVWTVNLCSTFSMATVILLGGTHGKRYALDNTLTHIHSGSQIISGRTDDVEKIHEYNKHMTEVLMNFISENTKIAEYEVKKSELVYAEGRVETDKKLREKLVREFLKQEVLFSPEEAKEAGIIDAVLVAGDPSLDGMFMSGNAGITNADADNKSKDKRS